MWNVNDPDVINDKVWNAYDTYDNETSMNNDDEYEVDDEMDDDYDDDDQFISITRGDLKTHLNSIDDLMVEIDELNDLIIEKTAEVSNKIQEVYEKLSEIRLEYNID